MGDIAFVAPVAVIVVEVMGKKSKQSSAAGMFAASPFCLQGSPQVDAGREQLYGPFYFI